MAVGDRYGFTKDKGDFPCAPTEVVYKPARFYKYIMGSRPRIVKTPDPDRRGKYLWVVIIDSPEMKYTFETMAFAAEFIRAFNHYEYMKSMSLSKEKK